MKQPLYKKYFSKFVKELEKRMEAGHREYGDKSFSRDPLELLGEVEEELMDISGWSLILYTRLKEIKKQLKKL